MVHGHDGFLPVSVLVLTKNEERNISACLSRLARFEDVVVVDSQSTDSTAELAEAHGARVVNFIWDGDYPKKKQWMLENVNVRYDWVLMLDADELVTDHFVDELARKQKSGALNECVAFDVPLSYWFSGCELKHGHKVSKRLLVRRGRVRFPEIDDLVVRSMGEVEGHYQPSVDGSVGAFRSKIEHRDQDPVSHWFARHNRYSDWEAHLRLQSGTRKQTRSAKSRGGKLFDLVPLKPLAFFIYSYVARRGFLDGRAGLDYALALAGYYWQIDMKARELRRELTVAEVEYASTVGTE